jgi:hypothetical protein
MPHTRSDTHGTFIFWNLQGTKSCRVEAVDRPRNCEMHWELNNKINRGEMELSEAVEKFKAFTKNNKVPVFLAT